MPAKPASISVSEAGDTLSIVAVSGDLDAAGVASIELKFLGATASRGRDTIVDLTGLDFIASLGLGMLIGCHSSLKSHGARLVLAGANAEVLDVLQRGRLDLITTIAPSVEEGVAALTP